LNPSVLLSDSSHSLISPIALAESAAGSSSTIWRARFGSAIGWSTLPAPNRLSAMLLP
jgi:hypothetical protein